MSSSITPDHSFDDDLKTAIRDELLEVLDPCSCMSEHPVNIVDLGLLEDIAIDDGDVEITLLLTSQRCTYFLDINDEIRERVGALADVDSVEVHQDTSGEIWTRERMSEQERTARRERFRAQMDAAGITPYAERSQ
ncbi:metal-sulfur cluster assembly factor [Salinirubrum litoreum]|uniref:Metal-sulfur cluster assembly factor n=1 Tax=Salinirubrum litoreum TaxID=1126234 RepID=A0ABD5RG74_9EURY|nr:iron-sulfur cluster assembly protein [Salinirubrum litoreum]